MGSVEEEIRRRRQNDDDLTSFQSSKHQKTDAKLENDVNTKLKDNWKCCSYETMPKWLQLNEYIVGGYRPLLPSFSLCFKSILRIHNESGNIWSHLIGFIVFLAITLNFMTTPSRGMDFHDKFVFGAFFVGAMCCLSFSTVYHTLLCHSETVKKNFGKMDYVGIALLIMGSFIPWLYYGFYCETIVRNIYMTITFVLGGAAIIASLWSKFGQSRFRPLRAGIFAGFGLSGVLPAVHMLITKGKAYSFEKCSLGHLFVMAGLYLLGAAIYAARIPERFSPGKFDLIFHSHQIFHVLVFIAAMVHYYGISIVAAHALNDLQC